VVHEPGPDAGRFGAQLDAVAGQFRPGPTPESSSSWGEPKLPAERITSRLAPIVTLRPRTRARMPFARPPSIATDSA